jgi:hypothetical protein
MMNLRDEIENEVIAWTLEQQATEMYGEDDTPIAVPVDFKEPEIVHFKRLKGIGIQGHPEWMDENTTFVKYCLDTVKEKLL